MPTENLPSLTVPRPDDGRIMKLYRRYHKTKFRPLQKAIAALYKLASVSNDIPLNAKIGEGMEMPHPVGIVINGGAEIGINCAIFQNVTIGGDTKIGNCVEIFAGAVIVGPLAIGDGVVVGANAVVTTSIPAFHIATGIPARYRPNLSRYPEKFSHTVHTSGASALIDGCLTSQLPSKGQSDSL